MFAKYFMTAALLGLSVCAQIQAEEKYVLYKEGSSLPVGSKVVTKTRMECDKVKIEDMTGAGRFEANGSMISQELGVGVQLAGDRIQLEITESSNVRKMRAGGQDLPEEKTQHDLLKVQLLGIRKDGEWDFKPTDSSLQLTEKQQEALQEVSKGFTMEESYSTAPRAVGETWDGSQEYLKMISGLDHDFKGEIKVTFEKIVDYKGQKCAVLTSKFHVTGRSDEGYTMKMTGEETTIRSLSLLFDLKKETKLMVVNESTDKAEGMRMTMPATRTLEHVVTLPKESE